MSTVIWLGVIHADVKAVMFSEEVAESWLEGVKSAGARGYIFPFSDTDNVVPVDIAELMEEADDV